MLGLYSLRTRVKICGITNLNDALGAVSAGADAIGLVFYAPSSRAVTIEQAADIVSQLPPFVNVVGLFVNAEAHYIHSVLAHVGLDLIQFHGDESPEYCESFNHAFIKAVRVKKGLDLVQCAIDYSAAKGLLLDAFAEGVPGGTGLVFDWALIPQTLPLPVILAGGLNADNVQDAIQQINPYAVDVSGGVEASKGIKDQTKMEAFLKQASSKLLLG